MVVPTTTPDASTDDTDSVDARTVDVPEHERDQDTIDLVTLVDDTAEGPQATICPASGDAAHLVTNWITVDTDHLLDLDDWR